MHQHRRRSSTSDAAKFREKLHQLSQSVEMQEHLVAESPREGEGEESGPDSSENKQELDNMSPHVKSAWGKGTDVSRKGEGGGGGTSDTKNSSSKENKEKGSRKGVLNLTEDKSNRDSTVATSVVNVGFDL